jgi:hypothetical protein
MQITIALVTLATVASAAIGSSPSAPAPPGCSASYSGAFEITLVDTTTPSKAKRQSSTCGQAGILTATLQNSILKDSQNRQGEIVANYQFQFDNPLQSGAVYTQGFSVCQNGSLALGGSAVFWECPTFGGPGIGNYSNLYSQSTGAQCSPILIEIIPCAGASQSGVVGQSSDGQPTATSIGSAVSQITDGQIQATTVAPKPTGCAISQISDGQIQMTKCAPVSQISDGQIQATATKAPVSQISDGQIQATTKAPVSQISDGQIQATTKAPVSQISDGQIQATTKAPVSQISDGQIQATTKAPVSQISDGQIQATTKAPVSQISDGQIQATTKAPVSQISDGQIQATTLSTKAPVSQVSDGQIQATQAAAANATTTPLQVTNSANSLAMVSTFSIAMFGLVAVVLL